MAAHFYLKNTPFADVHATVHRDAVW